ncbi:hypothetical protein BpHYR1_014638 [Brachionus plicatilis]|uniref:Uncharacterized protein n=1 Tax=Brachionus plicatilis TaxID=10195 RepID=A0A3M7RAL1_BRAPC|nr:hypothetical protein BpHYR1_014638 [Brachionus plicatilis]
MRRNTFYQFKKGHLQFGLCITKCQNHVLHKKNKVLSLLYNFAEKPDG